MAKKTESYLVDDFDGSKPAETVAFGYRGADYEIDLNEVNAREFDKDIARYIEAGRRVSGRNGRGGRRSEQRHQKVQAMRVWARKRGHEIGDRGRIPRELEQQFDAEQGQAS